MVVFMAVRDIVVNEELKMPTKWPNPKCNWLN